MIKITIALALVAAVLAQTPPVWPEQYTLSGTFTIPTYPATITEPLTVYSDYTNQQQRMDYYNSSNIMISKLSAPSIFYQVNPRIDTQYCWVIDGADYEGAMINVLPNVSTWTYEGTASGAPYCPSGSQTCDVWQQNVTTLNFTSVYTLFVEGNTPQTVVLAGYDQMFGSHPDLYVLAIDSFTPSVDSSVFDEPSQCTTDSPLRIDDAGHRQAFWSKLKMGQLAVFNAPEVPAAADAEWARFKLQHRKFYFSAAEERVRRAHWEANSRAIAEHNAAAGRTFTMKMNHLGDFSAGERKYMLHPAAVTGDVSAAVAEVTPADVAGVPDAIDWVTKGAVNPPKDQGVCGSCWTFGTAGSLEGAWAVKHGQLISAAEQQIVDCNWAANPDNVDGNQGCNGGFASGAFQWIQDNGGIAAESDYPYLMADGYCNAGITSSGATVQGYVNVTADSEDALQAAVGTYGPTAIAIDAAHPQFEFYESGVYYNPACNSSLGALDHEVLVVGYGVEAGQDFWLVKNSWSDRWGDKGFIKMARNRDNNCGIASQATFPLV